MATILVTGANRGIGLEFVRQYADDGAEVIACCRKPADAKELAALARAADVRLMQLDVAEAASAASLAQALNGEAVDILINNAGVFGHTKPSTAQSYYDEFAASFRINSMGTLIVSQALRDNLMRGRDKKLIALTSVLGSIAEHGGGWLSYRASKAALNSIARGLARDWAGDGIFVGLFHPGWVKTDMGGAGAQITPQESVHGLRARIAELSRETSGRYLDYMGKEIAW